MVDSGQRGAMNPVRESLDDIVQPAHTALLVIDVQEDLCHEACLAMVPTLQGLISTARAAGVSVVYAQNTELRNGITLSPVQIARRKKAGRRLAVTVEGTPGHDFVEAIAPMPEDTVVRKHRMNCFEGTDLDLLLRSRGIETIVCSGVATHGCVLSTACAAVSKDYYTVVVDDCSASWDPGLHSQTVELLGSVAHYVVSAGPLVDIWARRAEVEDMKHRFEEVKQ
jgi:nicotinamidase-related amidase